MNVVTRFAPSPTGFLHIGGARTALFNWLFARHHGGRYLLRIEDTDKERSTQAAVTAIHAGLDWLGLASEESVVSQSARAERHGEVAQTLVAHGAAYRCYLTSEELASLREDAKATGIPVRSPWRDRSDTPDSPFVIRMKMPTEGSTTIDDLVQGSVTVQNRVLDDMVIMRADGTPTYMLAVVVDDHDMGITHVYDSNFLHEYVRTPLGGFVNHNDEPNCRTVDIQGYKYLTALKNIEPGEELTLKYSMYNLDLVN